MDYEEFTDEFLKRLEHEMEDDDITLHRDDVVKENETMDGISVQFGDDNIAPVIYLQERYVQYEKGCPIEEIVDRTVHTLREARKNTPDMPSLTRAEAMRSLYCAVINAKDNEQLLSQVPYEITAGDLAVIAKYRLDDNSSFIVRNDVCGLLQMTPSEILEQAHHNTEQMDFSCRNINEVLASLMDFPDGMEQPEQMMPDCGFYVISNSENYDGAAAITSARFMDEVHTFFGEDFYIIPSSRHECLALKASIAPDEKALCQMIKEVNESQVDVQDRLSDHPYRYSGATKQVEMAGVEQDKRMEAVPEKKQARVH